MKKIFWALIACVVIIATVFCGYIAYGMGYDGGEKAGYDNGYIAGEGVGYQSGLKDGYQSGTDNGIVEGKKLGYANGYDIGQQDGYDSGLVAGRQAGYQDGYNAGETAGYDTGLAEISGHGYTIKDPTFAEVLAFLANDRTDEKPYVEPYYVCSHYSRDVCNNAEAAGIRCAVVELRYVSEQGHLIVAFNTTDRGLVYFEPQTDEQAEPAIGLRYYKTIICEPGYYYEPPDYNDTILDMVLIW